MIRNLLALSETIFALTSNLFTKMRVQEIQRCSMRVSNAGIK